MRPQNKYHEKFNHKSDYQSLIYDFHGYKVMLDFDLATLYGVETKRLKEQVRCNISRFPEDFMFELNKDEFESLRSHFATSKRGGTRYVPMVFTEQGVAMLSSVLVNDFITQIINVSHSPSPTGEGWGEVNFTYSKQQHPHSCRNIEQIVRHQSFF